MTNCGASSHLLKFLGHIWKTLGLGKFCDARVGQLRSMANIKC